MQSSTPNTQHPSPNTIEFLVPAKNLGCGMVAIEHGADAVYIGASRFGARQSAGNSVEDISKLCEYVYRYGATVHMTINTVIYNDELEDTLTLVRELVDVGVDAFLLWDMGSMSKVREIVPDMVAFHASTQCDTRTWEKALQLSQQDFDRVVFARELSAEEISNIHKRLPEFGLEAFVHGALYVSYSGVCYVSQYSFGRLANRGACAQFCRLAFDLKDSSGKTIEHQRHLLSLKDMSQIDSPETLMRPGVCAFEIEGRLKDINYMKNVVSAYSKRIDEVISKHPGELRRASLGCVCYSFTPGLKKTLNRGYTNYFLKGRQVDIFSPGTPKALGKSVGRVKEIRRDSFNVSSTANFANGDGLCSLSHDADSQSTHLEGFRANRAVDNRLYPFKTPRGLKPGMGLYRNQDQALDKELSGKTAERKIAIKIWFRASPDSSKGEECLADSHGTIWAKAEVIDDRINHIYHKSESNECSQDSSSTYNFHQRISSERPVRLSPSLGGAEEGLQLARKPQRDNIIRRLTKLGNTAYECSEVEIVDGADKYFVPSSILVELRRTMVEELDKQILNMQRVTIHQKSVDKVSDHKLHILMMNPSRYQQLSYLCNISNDTAREFYEQRGLPRAESAFEIQYPTGTTNGSDPSNKAFSTKGDKEAVSHLLMQCRHCIRYLLGYCVKRGGQKPTWREPLFLEFPDKHRFRLEFDCKNCQMNVCSVM